MEYGNTATPVSPVPTESEMDHVRAIFTRMADAIVSSATLNREVEELRQTVEMFKNDLDKLRGDNFGLDQTVVEARRQRDEAEGKARELERKLSNVGYELALAKQERDDLAFKNLELEEASAASRAKIAQAEELFCSKTSDKVWDRIAKPSEPEGSAPEPYKAEAWTGVQTSSEPTSEPTPAPESTNWWDKTSN